MVGFRGGLTEVMTPGIYWSAAVGMLPWSLIGILISRTAISINMETSSALGVKG